MYLILRGKIIGGRDSLNIFEPSFPGEILKRNYSKEREKKTQKFKLIK